jgi:hypothetical protein
MVVVVASSSGSLSMRVRRDLLQSYRRTKGLPVAKHNKSMTWVIRGQSNRHTVTIHHAYPVPSHFPTQFGRDLKRIFQFDLVNAFARFYNFSFYL